MNPSLRPYTLTFFLLALTLLLSAGLGGEWFYLKGSLMRMATENTPSREAPPEGELSPDSFALPGVDQFAQLAERPLFMETRRPSPPLPPGPVAKSEPPPPVTFKLMGVLETPEGRMALIADAKGKYKRIKSKDMVEGWEVSAIQPDHLILGSPGVSEDLNLLKKKPKGAHRGAPTPEPAPSGESQPPSQAPPPSQPMPHPGTPMAPLQNPAGGQGMMEPQDNQGEEIENEPQEAP
jgi:general secretion pathway protein N